MFAAFRIACIVCVLIVATPGFAAERQTLPGTSWSVVPPDGFLAIQTPVKAFLHASGAVLIVIDSPPQQIDMAKRTAKLGTVSGEGKNAMRVDYVAELTVDGRRAVLMRGYAPMRESDTVLVEIEGVASNGMIIALAPTTAGMKMADLETALLSAVETPKPLEERLAALPYRMDNLEGMRVEMIISGLAAVVTEGQQTEDEADRPFATIVALPVDTPQTISIESHAEEIKARIAAQDRSLARKPGSTILDTTMIDTPRGRVLEATYSYTDKKSGKPIAGVAWLRADGNRVVLVISRFPQGTSYYERFARIRDGVTLK